MTTGGGVPIIRNVYTTEIWSAITPQVVLVDAPLNPVLGILSIPSVSGILHAYLYVKFSDRDNTNVAANSISGAQNIVVSNSLSATAVSFSFVGGEYSTQATTYGAPGDVIMPTNDLATFYTGADTWTVTWVNALAALANFNFNNIQVGARIIYRA